MTISHLSSEPSNSCRQLCHKCKRPEGKACLCQWMCDKRWCNCAIHLFVLVHPRCQTSTGTVQLLLPMFSHLQLIFGKRFITSVDDTYFKVDQDSRDIEMLPRELTDGNTYKQVYLLFPPDFLNNYINDGISSSDMNQNDKIAVIIVDGSWRQAKSIIRHSPYLQTLPRIDLSKQSVETEYCRLKREPRLGFISTAEAVIYALQSITQDHQKKSRLCDCSEMEDKHDDIKKTDEMMKWIKLGVDAIMQIQFDFEQANETSKKTFSN